VSFRREAVRIRPLCCLPYALRFLFASKPAIMGRVLAIVYRSVATHLINKAGVPRSTSRTGAVTLIQRFGGALNLEKQP
jgi:hypothetical protein